MKMRAFAAMLSIAFVVACGGGAPATTGASSAPAVAASAAPTATPVVPIKMKVAYSNIAGDFLPVWTAQEAGIYKKNGLDVELLLAEGGSRTMSTLLANEINIGILGGAECLSATASGAKLVVSAVLAPVFPYLFMAAAEIKTPADLKGRKIGISSVGGSADIATRKVLRDFGFDPDKDVTLVSLGSHSVRTAALFSGTIQAAVDDPPNTAELVDKGFHSMYDLAGKKVASAQTVVVAQSAWVSANKDAMQRFIDSIVEATAYQKKNKAATVAVMKKFYGNSVAKGFEDAVDFYLNQVEVALPFPRAELWADAQAELSKTNEKVKAIDVKTLVDSSFVQSAADRAVDKR